MTLSSHFPGNTDMKNKRLFLKNVASASVLLASKFYTTKMTKLKVISKVLLITLKKTNKKIHLLPFNIHTQFHPDRKQAPPSLWQPRCYPTPAIWRTLRKYALIFYAYCRLQKNHKDFMPPMKVTMYTAF